MRVVLAFNLARWLAVVCLVLSIVVSGARPAPTAAQGNAAAASASATIPLFDGPDGATCNYFNAGGRVRWQTRGGDWIDAHGVSNGAAAFAYPDGKPAPAGRTLWDVTALAAAAVDARSLAILLQTPPGRAGATASFHSREAVAAELRPVLALALRDGRSLEVPAQADVHLDCSTARGLGHASVMRAGPSHRIAVEFLLPDALRSSDIEGAALVLSESEPRSRATADLGVFLLRRPAFAVPGAPLLGLAWRYPGDRGIAQDADVVMASGFEGAWSADWSNIRPAASFSTLASDDVLGFEPIEGRALRVEIARGTHLGLDLAYAFASKTGEEPEEIYFRYYLRFAPDWRSPNDAGKLPGLSGTYDRAGWGGRGWDGQGGWSMRGEFLRAPLPGNPLAERVGIGSYAYHAGQRDRFGDSWPWDLGARHLLVRNRWYCVEQYLKLNRPGSDDGEFKAWVDGELAAHRSGLRLRDAAAVRIEKVWMNVYHGGAAKAGADMHLFIDNVVVARRYIGPMRPAAR